MNRKDVIAAISGRASITGAASARTSGRGSSGGPASTASSLPSNAFMPAREKVTIVSLDTKLEVAAQFNPKELGISKTVQWQQHNTTDNRTAQQQNPQQGQSTEYTGGGQRTMSIELFFDRAEQVPDGTKPPVKTIEDIMEDLNTLASITDPNAKEPKDRRPHYCVVVWGIGGMRPFRCVIESLEIKYTMFDTMGVPLRAVATVKVKETAILKDGKDAARNDKEVRSLNGRK
ncbi:MAG: hypothetical protein WKG01_01440 [Kofleriaceae bacterium]